MFPQSEFEGFYFQASPLSKIASINILEETIKRFISIGPRSNAMNRASEREEPPSPNGFFSRTVRDCQFCRRTARLAATQYSSRLRIAFERVERVVSFSVRSRGHQAEHVIGEAGDEAIRLDLLRKTLIERFLDFVRFEELSDGDEIFQGGHAQMASLAQYTQYPRFEPCGIHSAFATEHFLSLANQATHGVALSAAGMGVKPGKNFRQRFALTLLQISPSVDRLANLRREGRALHLRKHLRQFGISVDQCPHFFDYQHGKKLDIHGFGTRSCGSDICRKIEEATGK